MTDKIFEISSETDFMQSAIRIFRFQFEKNPVYREFVIHTKGKNPKINKLEDIPFLPISFFKTHKVISSFSDKYKIFESSGTTGENTSRHYVSDISIYEKSFTECFKLFFGDIKDYELLALLPSYAERENSSLIYMVDYLQKKSLSPDAGFFLYNHQELFQKLLSNESSRKKTILIGVSFALLDFFLNFKIELKNTMIIETGGMKGRGKELVREELHKIIKSATGSANALSEYGMTELLSQAYCTDGKHFQTPAWLKILIRDTYDPFSYLAENKSGAINIIDLANINSCSFIETSDLGRIVPEKGFEVLGRYDFSDIRGCNLLTV